jgi:hypothetical protein
METLLHNSYRQIHTLIVTELPQVISFYQKKSEMCSGGPKIFNFPSTTLLSFFIPSLIYIPIYFIYLFLPTRDSTLRTHNPI